MQTTNQTMVNQSISELTQQYLSEILPSVFPSLTVKDFPVQKTRKEFKGDITITLFHAVKILKASPMEVGKQIGSSFLQKFPEVFREYEVVQGFLNLTLTDGFWLRVFEYMLEQENFGLLSAAEDALPILLEYCSPNTNKPLHLGHLRNIFLGYSMSEILKARGRKVITMNLVNDRGIHICKSMLMWIKDGRSRTPHNSGMKGDYLVGEYYVMFDRIYKEQIASLMAEGKSKEEAQHHAPILQEARELLLAWEKKDPSVWNDWMTLNAWVLDGFRSTLSRLHVEFHRWDFESQTYVEGKKAIEEGLKKNIFFKAPDGSVRVDLSAEGLDEKILLRADGTSVYITQDIGTALLRARDYGNIEGMIYTVGNEQDYHFKVLFRILEKLGYEWAKRCYHLSYGMVELPTGKMKSREGTVVDADELLDEMHQTAGRITAELGKTQDLPDEEKHALYEMVGQGALRYFLLKVDPHKKIVFNPLESIDFNGHTGPFIQYTYARIRSVLRKAASQHKERFGSWNIHLLEEEKNIIQRLYLFPEILDECVTEMSPAPLANYVYELSKDYNRFYHDVSILNAPDDTVRNFRLCLSEVCARQIRKAMSLLGIGVPERM